VQWTGNEVLLKELEDKINRTHTINHEIFNKEQQARINYHKEQQARDPYHVAQKTLEHNDNEDDNKEKDDEFDSDESDADTVQKENIKKDGDDKQIDINELNSGELDPDTELTTKDILDEHQVQTLIDYACEDQYQHFMVKGGNLLFP
jgi:hypothetical protein